MFKILHMEVIKMIEVQNINGSSKERYATPPRGYNSWLDYWKDNCIFPMPTLCSCKNCYNEVKVGAHVMKTSNIRKWYIVPLCYACNSKDEPFEVDEDYLVEVNQ